MAVLRRNERVMVIATCVTDAKLMEKKRTDDVTEILGLKETAVKMAKANGVRWYGHVLRRDDGHVLRKASKLPVRNTWLRINASLHRTEQFFLQKLVWKFTQC